jgi:DNA-binding response OmpR family regulator
MTDDSGHLLGGLRILVVEDEAVISFLLEDMLGELGAAEVRHAASVRAGISAIDAAKPDLAVLDVNLGGERVYPIAERLEQDGVRFVFITGYGKSGIDPRWSKKSVVQKPFNLDMLTNALGALLNS